MFLNGFNANLQLLSNDEVTSNVDNENLHGEREGTRLLKPLFSHDKSYIKYLHLDAFALNLLKCRIQIQSHPLNFIGLRFNVRFLDKSLQNAVTLLLSYTIKHRFLDRLRSR